MEGKFMLEVRFHGRGGQGAVTAAELLAVSAANEGKFSKAFPFFGVERRGAPVMSFCRIDDSVIRLQQQIYTPTHVVVLDEGLLGTVEVTSGLVEGGSVIVNTKKAKEELGLEAENVFTVDATGIALKFMGVPIVNTAMLGAFSKATNAVSLESIERAVEERFPQKLAERNNAAVEECSKLLR